MPDEYEMDELERCLNNYDCEKYLLDARMRHFLLVPKITFCEAFLLSALSSIVLYCTCMRCVSKIIFRAWTMSAAGAGGAGEAGEARGDSVCGWQLAGDDKLSK